MARRSAEHEAVSLLEQLDMTTYFDMPVNLNRIAQRLGLNVVYLDFDTPDMKESGVRPDASGFLIAPKKLIAVNANDPGTRQRFTLAHEIGHYQMHQGQLPQGSDVVYRDTISTLGTDPLERQANAFAAALLMPEDIFDAMSALYNDDAHKLAKFFGVSVSAVKIRLESLTEKYGSHS